MLYNSLPTKLVFRSDMTYNKIRYFYKKYDRLIRHITRKISLTLLGIGLNKAKISSIKLTFNLKPAAKSALTKQTVRDLCIN